MKTITIEGKTAKELRSHFQKELALFEEIQNITATTRGKIESRRSLHGKAPKKPPNSGPCWRDSPPSEPSHIFRDRKKITIIKEDKRVTG